MAEILERQGYLVRVRGEIPREEVEGAYRLLLSEYRKRARVPGFRPGRVPDKVLEARIGRDALLAEVRDELLERHLPRDLEELGLRPVAVRVVKGEPSLEGPFVYEAEVEDYPEVTLPDWRGYEIELKEPELGDDELERLLQDLRRRYAEVQEADREAREGDWVVLKDPEGQEITLDLSGAPEEVRARILGLRAGDEVELTLGEEPARYQVVAVQEVSLPELDDEFARSLGYDSLEEAREKLMEKLRESAAEEVRRRRKEAFLDRLASEIEVEIPPALLEAEERGVWEDVAADLASQGIPFGDYIKSLEAEGKLEEFKEGVRREALARVLRGLALEGLAKELGVELTEDEWRGYLDALAARYGVKPEKLAEILGEQGLKRAYLRRLHDKALDEALSRLRA